jgi:predicted hydrolase (HD superfamily)
MKKTTIKTFKRFIKEDKEKWYSLDLYSDMSKEDVIYYMNELVPLTLKMLKNTDVVISVEPVLDSEEQ